MMRIQNNFLAINAQRINDINDKNSSKKINRLSTGRRINSTADDSAGLAISEKMRTQILGMNQAARNVMDGISLIQTVEGALQTITDIVQRMRELAIQSASDTNQTDIDRIALNDEYQQLKDEIDEIVSTTTFNGVTPLAGEKMQPVQNTIWRAEVVSPPVVDVEIAEYDTPDPTQADVTGISTSFTARGTVDTSSTVHTVDTSGTVGAVGSVGSTSVSGSVGSVGTVNATNDLTELTALTGITVTDVASRPEAQIIDHSIVIGDGQILEINAASITSGVTDIVVGTNAKLIIRGNLDEDIKISGNGEVLVQGGASGLDIASGCRVQVTGGITGDVSNSGTLSVGGSITGNVTTASGSYMTADSVDGTITNSGRLSVTGNATGTVTNASSGELRLGSASAGVTNSGKLTIVGEASAAVINNSNGIMTLGSSAGSVTNSGQILVKGAISQLHNNSGATAELKNAAGTNITNQGNMELTGTDSSTNLSNSGNVRISSGTGLAISTNSGLINSYADNTNVAVNTGDMRINGTNAVVTSNSGDMVVVGAGATIKNNTGTMEVSGGNASIEKNNGYMLVSGSSATIDTNSSDMRITGSSATIKANAGDIYVASTGTGVTVESNASNIEIVADSAVIEKNAGDILISGANARVEKNDGDIQLSGQYATVVDNTKNILITGANATVNDNHGDIEIEGDSATVVDNTKNILITGDDGKITNNHGDIEAHGLRVTVNDNTKNIMITGADATVNNNHGDIEAKAANATINDNNKSILITGDNATVNNNHSDIEARGLKVTVNDNSKNIMITGENAFVYNNHGEIEAKAKSATVYDNSKNILITGENAVIYNNHGDIEARAQHSTTHDNYGNILITGSNATVKDNHGKIVVNASNVLVERNSYGGDVYSNIKLEVVRNLGRALLEANGIIVGTNDSSGNMIINGNAAEILLNSGRLEVNGTDASVTTNSGQLEINGDDMWIGTNTASGRVYADSERADVDSNSGELEIDGNYATVTNLVTGKLRINGADAEVINSGLAHIVGDRLELRNNDGAYAKVVGLDAIVSYNGVGSHLDLDGNNSTVNDNRGSAEINGENSTVDNNSGHLRLEKDSNATIGENSGRIEVSDESIITSLGTQTGTILVENGGRITDDTAINDGRIEVCATADIIIHTNNGTVLSKGKSVIDTNKGYLEIGEWVDDKTTPADGSDTGTATVTTNMGGLIRNFSQNLHVDNNVSSPLEITSIQGCECMAVEVDKKIVGGVIENYGKMNIDCLNLEGPNMDGLTAEIYHHARQVDVSGIELNNSGTIQYVANGNTVTYVGEWQSVLGGESGDQLFFDAKDIDNGLIVYSAGVSYEVPGIDYDIEERREVNGSVGTSGMTLMYRVPSGFDVQTGANQSDSMTVEMKILNTLALGALPDDDCGCVDCVCNLNTTNIKIRNTAICAIENCDQALDDIANYRGKLGASQNRLEYKLSNLEINAENLTATESRIRDADMAAESTELMKSQILRQGSMSMLLQANSLPQAVLQLLG